MSSVKPFKIIIEWNDQEDFNFSCDYEHPDSEKARKNGPVHAMLSFPVMAEAMGNVLKKLRKDPISFPLFLVNLAFNHRSLLDEIDQLLLQLHHHLENEQGSGTFSCHISSKKRLPL
ncbi:hypothetical protein [Chlorobium ferrooxidans]|nr:hypothetical protein [Chlorobium ferrooxidans]